MRRLAGWLGLAACLAVAVGCRPPPVEGRKLLLFGIDGATWDVIDPLLAEGRLPHLARLVARGSRAPLATLTPTISPPIWTTLATGALPETHGIESFVVHVPGTPRTTLPSSNLRRTPALWNLLSDAGWRVGVSNWWVSYPAEEVDGFVISDRASSVRRSIYRSVLRLSAPEMQARSPGETHPERLAAQLARALPAEHHLVPDLVRRVAALPDDVMAELDAQSVFSRENRLSVLKFVLLEDDWVVDATLHAFARHRPDFLAVFLPGLDAVEHHFWKFHEPGKFTNVDPEELALFRHVIPRYYEWVDQQLGRFLGLWGDVEPTVLVVSDHGHEADPTHGTPDAKKMSVWTSGGHVGAPDGILVVSGPDVVPGAALRGPGVADVTPTVLALMGVPVGDDMAGRVLEEVIDPGFLARHPVRRVASHAPAGAGDAGAAPISSPLDEGIKGKLRALGYIE